jgi:DNA polymerase III alpha subunit
MKERICRDGDEKTYQPKIHRDRIKELYVIGVETGLPMTVLVDYAIRGYVKAYNEDKQKQEEAIMGCEFRMEDEAEEQRERDLEDVEQFNDGTMYGF